MWIVRARRVQAFKRAWCTMGATYNWLSEFLRSSFLEISAPGARRIKNTRIGVLHLPKRDFTRFSRAVQTTTGGSLFWANRDKRTHARIIIVLEERLYSLASVACCTVRAGMFQRLVYREKGTVSIDGARNVPFSIIMLGRSTRRRRRWSILLFKEGRIPVARTCGVSKNYGNNL